MRGMLRIIPGVPHSSPPRIRAMMAAMGLMLTFEPVIIGVMKLPSRNCTNVNTPTTAAALPGEPVSTSVISAGIADPTMMPM